MGVAVLLSGKIQFFKIWIFDKIVYFKLYNVIFFYHNQIN